MTNNKPPTGKGTVLQLLARMTWFAERCAGGEPERLARLHRYVRLGGDGLKPVSLELHSPCGEISDRPSRKFHTAAEAASRADECISTPVPAAGNRKLEHRLQAYLIRRAVLEPDSLLRQLHLDGMFRSLRLVTDELRLEERVDGSPAVKLRADLLFLVQAGNAFRPMFVELKIKHDPKDSPFRQLDAAARAIESYPEQFRSFLSAASSRGGATIDPSLIDPTPALLAVLPFRTERTNVVSFHDQLGMRLGVHEARTFSAQLLTALNHVTELPFFIGDEVRDSRNGQSCAPRRSAVRAVQR